MYAINRQDFHQYIYISQNYWLRKQGLQEHLSEKGCIRKKVLYPIYIVAVDTLIAE